MAHIEGRRKRLGRDLEPAPQTAEPGTPDEFDDEAVLALIDEFEELAPDDGRAPIWRSMVGQRVEERQSARRVAKLCGEIERHFAEAVEYERQGASDEFVLERYKQASRTAGAAVKECPGVIRLKLLHSRAEAAYNRYQSTRGVLQTLAVTGHFRWALNILDELEEAAEIVMVVGWNGLLHGYLTIDEAQRFYRRDAADWVMNRTPSKLRHAHAALEDDHSPALARRILADCVLLVGYLMPDPEADQIAWFIEHEIEPAEARRRRAEYLLYESETAPMDRLGEAWGKILAASDPSQGGDPHTPDLSRVKELVHRKLALLADRLLREARIWLDEEMHSLAEKRATEALATARVAATPELNVLEDDVSELLERIRHA